MKKSRFIFWSRVLCGICIFVSVGAAAGGVCMIIRPSGEILGMQSLLPFFEVLPFSQYLFKDYLFPGFALIAVNCIPNAIASYLILKKKSRSGAALGAAAGGLLMAWIIIQFCIFPPNFLDNTYFTIGVLQALCGIAACIFYTQEHFSKDESLSLSNYKNIGSSPEKLVVYYSRLGYTKREALRAADKSGAAVLELQTPERTENTAGFLMCGRAGMLRAEMPVNTAELSGVKSLTVCSPIWVFSYCAPVRAFIKALGGRYPEIHIILTHFMRAPFKSAAEAIKKDSGASSAEVTSVCTRFGKIISQKNFRV